MGKAHNTFSVFHKDKKVGVHTFWKNILKNKILLLMLLPSILYVIIFNYIPMGGIIVAFKNYNYQDGFLKSPWVGFENFRYLLISNKLWLLTRNTILYNVAFILTGMIVEVGVAILLSEMSGRYFKKICQSAMLLPFFISWVIVAAIVLNIFSFEYGVLNNFLRSIGAEPFDLYTNQSIFPLFLILLRIWKNTGYGSVIYLAAITGIDREMYEAAEIDGASIWQRIRYITIPCLRPTMVIMLILALGQVFKGDFGMFYQIVKNNQILLEVADIIDTFVYRSLMSSTDIGMSAAASLYQSVMGFITVIIANKIVKKVEPDYALF